MVTGILTMVPFHKSAHKILTEVVPYCKLDHNYIKWITNVFRNRRQAIVVNSSKMDNPVALSRVP